ncbi:MAG: carboxypeptidase regulatory-like domain-containing protein [Caldilineaceae bacterium]|nr:carboxypeptidase regulatory-like domain-containing protein [Caldilineaceae bacterium]
MQLSDYPRPPDDNGRGVHWSARIYHPSGSDLDFWISELTAMHMKWIKVLDDGDGSSLELCRRLLDAGMMPVVRLFRERPNPGRIGGREVSGVRKLVAAGVRYMETNNEPDLPAEWEKNHKPDNWLDIVVDNFIYDADIVTGEGGLIAVPAMGPGGRDNAIERVMQQGRGDLFEKGCWLAIHNYTLNHPLDYPDDPVNQMGQPLTREEFERHPAWSWDHRSMEMINARRARDKNPGQTLAEDAACFRGWEWAGQLMFHTLGRHLPVISTEGGPVVGWGDDLRYNKITPDQQAEMQIGITRFLQESAPEWYFSCCTWLLASRALGDFNPTWEQMSWYTDAWNERFGLAGRLPIVQALKELPPVVRPELRRGTASLTATIVRGDNGQPLPNIPVALESTTVGSGSFRRRIPATTDGEGHISLEQVPADSYQLLLFDTVLGQVTLADGETEHLDLAAQTGQRSTLRGKVTDPTGAIQPGLAVSLHQTNPNRLVAQTKVDAGGSYEFGDLTAGIYALHVAPGTEQATERRGIDIDGWENEEQNLSVPQAAKLRYQVTSKKLLSPQETGNENKIQGQVLDAEGKPLDGKIIRMRWTGAAPETNFPTVKSGQDPFKPRGYFSFIHTPGVFAVEVMDPAHESEVADNLITADMPQHSRPITYEVTFQLLSTAQPAARSSIAGRIPGGPLNGAVTLSGGGGDPKAQRLDQQRAFRFDGLAAGVYQLSLEGVGMIAEELVLSGIDEISIEFPMQGQINGQVLPAKAGEKVSLTCQEYSIRKQATTGPDGIYRLTGLPADVCILTLEASDLPAQKAHCDGQSASNGPVFDREQGEQSVLSGQITTHTDEPAGGRLVFLRTPGRRVAETQTDDDGRYRFAGLAAASYSIELEGQGIVASAIRLDGVADVERDVRLSAPRPQTAPSVRPSRPDAGQPSTDKPTTGQPAPATKPLRHYLLLDNSNPAATAQRLTAAQDFIFRTKATVGFDRDVVTKAEQVTIVGPVSSQVIQNLAAARIPVQRVSDDLDRIRQELEAL